MAQVKLLVDLQIEEWDVSGGNGRARVRIKCSEMCMGSIALHLQ